MTNSDSDLKYFSIDSDKSIRTAEFRIKPYIFDTPLLECTILNKIIGFRLLVKAESLQRTGSFKFRGALNKILSLTEQKHPRHILTWSSGNHGIAVAEAGKLIDCQTTIVVPKWASDAKIAAMKERGASVETALSVHEIANFSIELAKRRGATVIENYDDIDIISGQATTITDAMAQFRQKNRPTHLDCILVPCGSGSLAAGASLALRKYPEILLYGAEPTNAADMKASLEKRLRTTAAMARPTICDALRNSIPGHLTFRILKKTLSQIFLVEDTEVKDAMKLIFERFKVVAEPAGAIAVAAALQERHRLQGRTVIAVLSGGNVTTHQFSALRPQRAASLAVRI